MNVASRMKAFGAALLSLVGGNLRVQTDAVAVDDAPMAWVAYAEQVAQRLQSILDGTDDAACRLRTFLEQRASLGASAGIEAPVLRLKTWLDADGQIERVECVPRCKVEIEADLNSAAIGRHVGKGPPRGMIQPIVVQLGALVETDEAVGR